MWTLECQLDEPEPMALRAARSLDHNGDFRHLMLRVLMEVVEPLWTLPGWRLTRLPFAAEAVIIRLTDCKYRAFHQTTQCYHAKSSEGRVDAAAEIRKVKDMSRTNGSTVGVQAALSRFIGNGITPKIVYNMLKILRYDADTAYFLFKWAGEQTGYNHEIKHYDFMVQLLACDNQFDHLDVVLEEMVTRGMQPGYEASLAMVLSYANAGLVDKAVDVVYELRGRRRHVVPVHIYNSLFNALDRLQLHQRAYEIIEDLMKTGYIPRESTSDILVRMFCCCGALDRAVWLLRRLSQRSAQVNPLVVGMVVDALCRAGRCDTAEAVYEDAVVTSMVTMADTGFAFSSLVCGIFRTGKLGRVSEVIRKLIQGGLVWQFSGFPFQEGGRPYSGTHIAEMVKAMGLTSTFSYNTIVEGLCKAGNLDEAQHVFNEMRVGNVAPDIFTYSIIIDGICKAGRVEDAEKMLEGLEKADVVIYTNLVVGFCDAGRLENAFLTFQRMKDAGCEPDVVIYNALVHGLCKARRPKEALKLMWSMVEARCEPDEVTYSTVVDYYMKSEDWLPALDVFGLMRQRECPANVDLYGRLAHCLCKSGKVDSASALLQDMLNGKRSSGLVLGGELCKPNIYVYNTVINGLCESHKMDEAFVVLKVLQDEGLEPDAITYTTFIKTYCDLRKVEKAMEVLDVMVKAGCKPDAMTYNTLFLGLCFVGLEEDACGLLQRMLNTGVQPDVVTFKLHIETLCKRNMLDAAVCLLDFMKLTSLVPDMTIFKTLVYAHYALGRVDEARQILQEEAKAFSWRNPGTSLVSELHEASTPDERKLLEAILMNGI